MKAKQYLSELEKLNKKIDQKIIELHSLRCMATRVSPNMEGERVQCSMSDKLGDIVTRIVDLDNEINHEIDIFVDKKHTIINQIQGLKDVRHMELLFKRYVEFKDLAIIADETNYTYQYARELHGLALQEFERTYTNLH